MTFTKAQRVFIGITIIVVLGSSIGGCQKQPEEYTGPVEKITLGGYDVIEARESTVGMEMAR